MSSQRSTFSSGNRIVDEMYGIDITGNIVPLNWFKTIKRPNGKPNSIAIMLLSDFVYWYRPRLVRDEQTGEFIGIEKRFKADLLQRSYKQLAEQFGYSKRQVADAVKELEVLGVIHRVFRSVSLGIQTLNNVLYIKLIPKRLVEITFPGDFENAMPHFDVGPASLKRGRVSLYKDGALTTNESTNTENSTKNTTTNYRTISINAAISLFKNQIDYEAIVCDLPSKKPLLDEIISIAAEVLTSNMKTIRVNREERPVEYVKERLHALNIEHIKYILTSLDNNMSEIKNVRAFIITSLYNAPTTMDSYYAAKVNHDLSQ